MAAPEQQELVVVFVRGARTEKSVDGLRRRLRAGQAAVALSEPVAELREGPGVADGFALGGANGRAVGLSVHADGVQVIPEVRRGRAGPGGGAAPRRPGGSA